MLVTVLGIVIAGKALQPEKAEAPIVVTVFGRVTDVKAMQF